MIINFFSFIYNCSSNMNYFIYTSHREHNKIKLTNGKRHSVYYWVTDARGRLLSTKEAQESHEATACVAWRSLSNLKVLGKRESRDKERQSREEPGNWPIRARALLQLCYLLFKENLSELQPCMGNWYLVSWDAGNNVSECSFLKISRGSMLPDLPPSSSSRFKR